MKEEYYIYLGAIIWIVMVIGFFNLMLKIVKIMENVKIQLELLNKNTKKIVPKSEPVSDIDYEDSDNGWGGKKKVPIITN